VLLSKFNSTRNKCVLRGTIDEGNTFEDARHSKDSGWCDFLVAILNCFNKVLSSVIDSRNEVGETLSVCSPLNNDLVQVVRGLEVSTKRVSF
jgi:hypothetical protein